MGTVENASAKIQALILNAKMPDDIATTVQDFYKKLDAQFVAVRSSATAEDSASAAWAGQLDSFLNTTEETLLANVQKCWASLFTPRAIFYRFEKELHTTKISVAVVVQKMVQSEVSGIAFSVHPVTEDYNQLIIEAGFGLGEAIVSGSVTPDSYVIEKEPRRIIDKNITYQSRALWRAGPGGPSNPSGQANEWRELSQEEGSKPALSDEQALELAEIILRIESHYGFPCDIEWAFEAGTFFITQSRPITTLAPKKEVDADNGVVRILTREGNASVVEAIKNTAWHSDWSGPFSLFGLSLPTNTYSEGMEKYFGKGLDRVFVAFKNGIAFSRLPEDQYHELGIHLIQKAQDSEFVREWASQFKKTADRIRREISVPAEQYIKKLPELLRHYQAYGSHNVATKIAFDVGHDKLTRETKDLLEEARKYSETFYKDDALTIEKSLRFLAEKTRYPYEEISMLMYDELNTYLAGGVLPPHEILKKRWSASGVYFTRDKTVILSPEELAQIENARIGNIDPAEIKGQIAYKGKVQGRCRIVLDYQNASFEKGDILVTGMTDPHFVELMKKASAIVTDGGGMLSHAAIVARELRTPCIIGTKIATQVLKDGDLIEVDADNGVVRILKSREEYSPKDYIRMFAGKSFTYLFSDMFLDYYGSFGVLSIQDEKSWISFFPKTSEEKTLQEGKKLYSSKELYEQYALEFGQYIKSSSRYFESVLAKERISASEVRKFFELASRHWFFYSKTEFFYTDLIDQKSMVLSVQDFDKLKLDGRSYLNKIIFEENGFVKRLLKIISAQTQIPSFDLLHYSVEEMVALIKTNSKVPADMLKERDIFFASEKLTLFGENAKNLVEKFLSIYREISNVIKGTTANKGRVRAKARVLIPNYKDFNKIALAVKEMEDGEILVAETTSPEIILACKKAAAIVTNQGGMLSHAAIVSRELGIPCIIGTDKDVILNINTGDELEVDADKGIVKIIRRKG